MGRGVIWLQRKGRGTGILEFHRHSEFSREGELAASAGVCVVAGRTVKQSVIGVWAHGGSRDVILVILWERYSSARIRPNSWRAEYLDLH